MTRSEAKGIAVALAAEYHPSYFTTTADFEPHEWVIQAILRGQLVGYRDGLKYAVTRLED